MEKVKQFLKNNLHWWIVLGVALLCVIFMLAGQKSENGYITLDGKDANISDTTKDWIDQVNKEYRATLIYSDENIPGKIVTENGEETVVVPTLESVDGVKLPDDEKTSSDGKGAYHNTTTYLTYYNSVGVGNCINNAFGAQCFALADDFWQNYTGRALSSCGTGAAKGTLNCYEYNAGNEFEMIWDASKIQPGDWVVFTSGTWGHIGMAMGYNNNGYIALFGQNQGGGYCAKGGSATNVVNLSLKSFGGAFRPKTYIKPDPTPPSGDSVTYTYVKGDYFSKVLVKLGYDENNLWGENGSVKYYTNQLVQQNVLDRNGNVFIGVPFTLKRR